EILGAAVATGVPNATSVNGLVSGFPSWFVVPYLIFAILQLFAINTIDLYSSGVTLQSIFPGLRRLHCVAIDTVVCGAVAAYAVFSSRFYTLLADFLLFIIVWLGPWCAIYLVDSWLRRNRYDHDALLTDHAGRYFRNGGFHWPAIVAQAVGMVAAALWLNAYPPYVSILSRKFDGSDFSVFLGPIVGGLLYWLVAPGGGRGERQATPPSRVQCAARRPRPRGHAELLRRSAAPSCAAAALPYHRGSGQRAADEYLWEPITVAGAGHPHASAGNGQGRGDDRGHGAGAGRGSAGPGGVRLRDLFVLKSTGSEFAGFPKTLTQPWMKPMTGCWRQRWQPVAVCGRAGRPWRAWAAASNNAGMGNVAGEHRADEDRVDESVRARPAGGLLPIIAHYTGYRQRGVGPARHRGLPSPFLTLIFTLDDPLMLARHPDPRQPPGTYQTLAAGLHTSPAL